MDYPDVTLYAIPFFVLCLALEPLVLMHEKKLGRSVLGYEWRDAVASLALGIGSLFFVTVINIGIYSIATWLAHYALFNPSNKWLLWTVALVGWDFLYYWHHRAEHEIRILWACHVNHHSSQYYNFSTALRQPWSPFAGLIFYPPLALLGIPPWMIMVSAGINLIYQYWVHTEAVHLMPRWFEALLNTPSHHRVHHGSNTQYLDKNYAGILIIWDRLFGTFTPEQEPVVYGLTKNINTYNILKIAFHEYISVFHDIIAAPGWRNKCSILFQKPGWHWQ